MEIGQIFCGLPPRKAKKVWEYGSMGVWECSERFQRDVGSPRWGNNLLVVTGDNRDASADIKMYRMTDLFHSDGQLVFDGLFRNLQNFCGFPVFKPVFFYQFERKFAAWG